jgi:hypothetical protein
MEKKERLSTAIFRIFSWIFNILGHFILFIPLISLMNFIPFVAYLLSKMNSTAASFVFSLIYGSAIFSIVLTIEPVTSYVDTVFVFSGAEDRN